MKIGICIPSEDEVKTDFAIALWALSKRCPYDVVLLNIRTSLLCMSRYNAVKSAMEYDCDYIFSVDSDLSFPADALERLVSHNKDIVAATYVRRREPHTVLGYAVQGVASGNTGLVLMHRMPIGFSLIKMDVFKNISKPWFPISFREEDDDFTSEDYGFCDLAREANYKLWCDLDLSHELMHVGTQAWWWGDSSLELKTKD